ncbi:MAG: hypothetical protein HY851_03070 [candidate division Zixibacteria bacterium]|nr:hypothetical protein [candidate division Zixibacteria bacterium]
MKNESPAIHSPASLRSNLRLKLPLGMATRRSSGMTWSTRDLVSGGFKTGLYRFLAENIPAIHSCIWTWAHLASAPGRFKVLAANPSAEDRANDRLKSLGDTIMASPGGRRIGLAGMIPELFTVLFRDGMYGGFVVLSPDGSRVDQFLPVDPADIRLESSSGQPGLFLETAGSEINLQRPEFFHLAYNADVDRPFGRSILQAVPFVAYIEQQLIDDMRRSSHNSGFHRLHVKITPPERMSGESDTAYTGRANSYFDATVDMIKSCEIDDNPVTWDNVAIEYIGPDKSRDVTNSWFMSHRAMIEEICAATNLAPYLLGYSYGATTTWSGFKFDVVMRQVRSVQAQAAQLLEWLGNLDLALAEIDARCEFHFDNTFAYQVKDDVAIQSSRIDNILKLFQAGLIDETAARQKAWEIL